MTLRTENLAPEEELIALRERVKKHESTELARTRKAARLDELKAELKELRSKMGTKGDRDPVRLQRSARVAELEHLLLTTPDPNEAA